jgi:hypothetical protein
MLSLMSRSPVEADHSGSLYLPLSIAAGLILLGIGGAAFYGWIAYGSSIFLAMAETGLSWCL